MSSPQDRFLTPPDVDTYLYIHAYLLAIQSAHFRVTQLFALSVLRREYPAPKTTDLQSEWNSPDQTAHSRTESESKFEENKSDLCVCLLRRVLLDRNRKTLPRRNNPVFMVNAPFLAGSGSTARVSLRGFKSVTSYHISRQRSKLTANILPLRLRFSESITQRPQYNQTST